MCRIYQVYYQAHYQACYLAFYDASYKAYYKASYQHPTRYPTSILQGVLPVLYIHSDLCGVKSVPSNQNVRYPASPARSQATHSAYVIGCATADVIKLLPRPIIRQTDWISCRGGNIRKLLVLKSIISLCGNFSY